MTIANKPGLMEAVRDQFAHVESCPFQGSRIFFENAGGALTLKSVVETSARFAAIPDNQGRDNPAAEALMNVIKSARADAATLFNTSEGYVFVGESGTELIFRLIRAAVIGSAPGGHVLGSTVEHPATRSAAQHWAQIVDVPYVAIPHDDARGLVTPEAYAAHVTPETRVATILHTSPVTGMGMDIAGIVQEIRAVAPDAFIVVDGIQHACHGAIDLAAYDVDGYVISPYKVFSRHGYGVAWVSERLRNLPHEHLIGGPPEGWEFGTRDTGAYATFSDVVAYFDWLGAQVSDAPDRRSRIEAASDAIHTQETLLTTAAIDGVGNLMGLREIPGISIIGGPDNPAREGLVSFSSDKIPALEIVAKLNAEGIRTHTRKADHYSGNILNPLGLDGCIRVSFCHYNTEAEVARFLSVMHEITAEQA